MIQIEFADFYITNVCNLNCTDCNRFNNYAFTGHQRWADYVDAYTAWSKIVSIKRIVILGGEPMLNPDFIQWVDGLSSLWPRAHVEVLTNGTAFGRWPEFYLRLQRPNITVRMSAHSSTVSAVAQTGIDSFLVGPVTKTDMYFEDLDPALSTTVSEKHWLLKYQQIKLPDWPECTAREDFDRLPASVREECKQLFGFGAKWGSWDIDAEEKWAANYNAIRGESWPDCATSTDFYKLPAVVQHECATVFGLTPLVRKPEGYKLTDINGVSLSVMDSYKFFDTMLTKSGNTVKFQTGNGRIAHSNCCYTSVQWQAFQFSKGRLWKCGPVAVFDDFSRQFAVAATAEQLAVINSYEPCSPDWELSRVAKFIEDLLYEIPACSLCPENVGPMSNLTNASFKKIKIVKIS